ncbi:oligosaccharide repeat unit polymerase [Salinicoccus roseus]|uniref:O-antigen ligase-like membrane protein n=1 Tax=Salinicoccus roseus TaxID=45670 RepID=A0A265E6I3_9STAP|nr:oligosaccharide repeat unit polymerase [Salinicoccus roseus]OZT77105.1 hypothetical protein CFN03_08495 [Salinicoccus roseus]
MEQTIQQTHVVRNRTPSQNIGLKFFKMIHKLLALIVIAWLMNGMFTFVMPYFPNFLRYGTFALWLAVALVTKPKFAENYFKRMLPLLLFFTYILIVSFFTDYEYISLYPKNILYLIIIYSIFLYYVDNRYRKFQKKILTFIIFDLLFIGINTYLKLIENPQISRYLSAGTEAREMYLGATSVLGIGNYGFFYGLVSIILLLGFLIFYTRKLKILYVLLLFASIALMIKASFTIAILFAFIFLFMIILMKYVNKNIVLLVAPAFLILMVLARNGIAQLFNKIGALEFVSFDVSVRFYELASFFSNHSIDGTDLLSRLDRYKMSIYAFLNNFISGTTIGYNQGYLPGGHSTWFDLLALFGVFSIPFFLFLIQAYKHSVNLAPVKFHFFVKLYWMYFLCLGFINTVLFANIFIIWLLFLPFLINYFFGKKEMDLEEKS